jgi:hypothetical protein
MQGPGLFEPIHVSAPDIAGQVEKQLFVAKLALNTQHSSMSLLS